MLAPGSDRLPVELFQILKDYAVKVLHSICNMLGDGSWHGITREIVLQEDFYKMYKDVETEKSQQSCPSTQEP